MTAAWIVGLALIAWLLIELVDRTAPEPGGCSCPHCAWYVTGAPEHGGKEVWIGGRKVEIRPLEEFKVFLDLPWSPASNAQAESRLHRLKDTIGGALLEGLLLRPITEPARILPIPSVGAVGPTWRRKTAVYDLETPCTSP